MRDAVMGRARQAAARREIESPQPRKRVPIPVGEERRAAYATMCIQLKRAGLVKSEQAALLGIHPATLGRRLVGLYPIDVEAFMAMRLLFRTWIAR